MMRPIEALDRCITAGFFHADGRVAPVGKIVKRMLLYEGFAEALAGLRSKDIENIRVEIIGSNGPYKRKGRFNR